MLSPINRGPDISFRLNAEIIGLKKLVMFRALQKSMDTEMRAQRTARRLLELG